MTSGPHGSSLIPKVDSQDIKVGVLVTESCRQFQVFTLSLYSISSKVDSSNLQVAGFLAGCWHLMRTLGPCYCLNILFLRK